MMMSLLLVASAAAPPAPLHPGPWSNIRYSAESGDVGGLAGIVPAAGATAVYVTSCEGGCSARTTVPIRRDPIGFTFDYVIAAADQNGTPLALKARPARARFDGELLAVLWRGEDAVDILRHRATRLDLRHMSAPAQKSARPGWRQGG